MADDTVDDVGEDQDDDQTQAPNVEERLESLEKILKETIKERDDEKSRSAGLDRKVTDLTAEKKALQKDTLSKDTLLDLREAEIKEREEKAREEMAAERTELQLARIEIMKHNVLGKLDNFPMRFADRVTGTTEEEIEADARALMRDVQREVEPIKNAGKITGAPRAGGKGKPSGLASMSPEDALKLEPEDIKKWSLQASAEDVLAFLELQRAQKK